MKELKEFIGVGTLTLNGVEFGVWAETLEEARELMSRGEWEWWREDGAEAVDFHIAPNSIVEEA